MSVQTTSMESVLALVSMVQKLQAYTVINSSMNGVMLWELVTCFPSEARHIFWPELKMLMSSKSIPSLPSILLFNARLLTIPLVVIPYIAVSPKEATTHFNSMFRAYVFMFSASVVNALAIFVIRTLAIRDSKRTMTICLWTFYAGVSIFHICCAALVVLPGDLLSMSAVISPLRTYLPWILFLVMNVIFDVVVLTLSLEPQFNGFTWKPTYSNVAKRFYFGAIMYFGISLAVTIFDLSWIIVHRGDGVLVTIVVPVHIWLCVVIAPRVIRNLRLHSAKQRSGASHELSKSRSPFHSDANFPPVTSSCSPQTTGILSNSFEISKERTHYVSSLYSTSGMTHAEQSAPSMV